MTDRLHDWRVYAEIAGMLLYFWLMPKIGALAGRRRDEALRKQAERTSVRRSKV